ncbi:MAG: polyprenyl synthetase family protein, partial [Lachnospiraceae bacterium]|nr:polyprenyl synthetase family protein [Lachnospiraceae bacterium]
MFALTFKYKVSQVEEILRRFLPSDVTQQRVIAEAMEYALMGGGKRLRPIFMAEVYELFGGTQEDEIQPFMAAIEMIHSYSLVHDDLPAMDNDDYRRGRETTHKVYGEAMGILAGDALL